MRVGLDLLYLLPGETGGREAYARELVPALLERNPQLELVAFVNREAGAALVRELGDGIEAVVLPVSPRSRVQWAAAELALVAREAQRAGVELLHSMANFGPAHGRFRRVLTLHDLQYRVVPEQPSWPMRAGTSALVRAAARGAHRIIAVSKAGREEIVAGLGVAPEDIDVVPNGLRPPPAATALVEPLELQGPRRGRPVALVVATNVAHKNLPAAIRALAFLAVEERPLLVLAGHGTDNGSLQAQARAAGVGEDVLALGALAPTRLESLYAAADCLLLPTLHEGFGLPVLEAMARGLPVLCSDIASLRELAGDAALYFDPREPAQIAATLAQALAGPALRAQMRERGLARAPAYSWPAAAAGTLATYRRALLR